MATRTGATLTGLLTAWTLALAPQEERGSALEQARAALQSERFEEAAALLETVVARDGAPAEAHELRARALEALGRADAAADELEHGLAAALARGQAAVAGRMERRLFTVDPLARRRREFLEEAGQELFECASRLLRSGHAERALAVVTPLERQASGGLRRRCADLRDRALASIRRVQLEEEASGRPAEPGGPLEGAHYRLVSSLDEETARSISRTMDGVFQLYVDIYHSGDARRAPSRKANIHVYPTREEMASRWNGPPRELSGWWSAQEGSLLAYDTRTDMRSLEPLLLTLFHEASHQFMHELFRGRAAPPSWIDEGTACFFEGARAMEDGRVLWPDAPPGRLRPLVEALRLGSGPTLAEVIGYAGPGAYPAEYYPFGWGLVYYLLEYEDPETLELSWRPYYDRYRDRITSKGGDARALFDEVFLEPGNPGDFSTLEELESAWQEWILVDLARLHGEGARARERLAAARRLLSAARTSGNRKAGEELRTRALRHLEHLEASLPSPDADLLRLQAEALEGLGRPQEAALPLERLLELRGQGKIELSGDEITELLERLLSLEGASPSLQHLHARRRTLERRALDLLGRYEAMDGEWVLRPYDFARAALAVLGKAPELESAKRRLRTRARASGGLFNRTASVEGARWGSLFRGEPGPESSAGSLLLEAESVRGAICLDLPLEGDYVVRGTLDAPASPGPSSPPSPSSIGAIVVAGHPESVWYAVGIGPRHQLRVLTWRPGAQPYLRIERSFPLTGELAAPRPLALSVGVRRMGRLAIRIGEDGGRVHSFDLPGPLPEVTYAGILVREGAARILGLEVERTP